MVERTQVESYDEYEKVLVHLGEKTRIIECGDGIQWIIQQARTCYGKRTWRSDKFCRTKAGLFYWAGVRSGEYPRLDALPDSFPGRSGTICDGEVLPQPPACKSAPAAPRGSPAGF